MSEQSKPKKFFEKLKKIKHIEIIIAVVAVAVMLVLYFSTKAGSAKAEGAGDNTTSINYCEKTEQKLTQTLSVMKGVGKTKIIINWESSVESVIAYITNSNGNSISSTPQLIQQQGSTKPIILKEIYPKVVGVIIICQGGDDVKTKFDVTNAVSVLLNISRDKISVFAMTK